MISLNLIGSDSPSNDKTNGSLPTFSVTHPGTTQVAHRVQRSTAADLTKAVDTCYKALPAWRATPVVERTKVVYTAIKLLEDESSGWAQRIINANRAETSVTDWWSAHQVHVVPLFFKALAEAAPKVLAPETIKEGHCECRTQLMVKD